MKLLKKARFIWLFLVPFIILSSYILFFKTELFSSSSSILIKDLTSSSTPSDLMSALMPTSSSNMQDSMLLEKYIKSEEMFHKIDKEFSLREHYESDALDMIERLYSFSTMKDVLSLYESRLQISYDELSSTLDIEFLHADPAMAKKILEFILIHAGETLNLYDKENGNILLDFIQDQESQNKRLLTRSIEKLLAYQNAHKTIDPSIDIEAKSSILGELEAKLVQKETEYDSLRQYMNPKSTDLKLLRGEIASLKRKSVEIKSKLAGSEKSDLNENVFDFETLKAEVEFAKERYKQTLVQLDLAMIQSTQNSKNLIVVTRPTLPDYYSQPNKIKSIITMFLLLLLTYGIFSMIHVIIKDHRD